MRHQYLCIAAILSAALLGNTATSKVQAATGSRVGGDSSPIVVINMTSHRWNLPEFRMAGKNAYAIVKVENTHDYQLKMFMSCRGPDGRIPELTGYHTIKPRQFMQVDTRRFRDPMQKGKGVKVTCMFRADGSAKVEAWVYDKSARNGRNNHGS